MTRRRHRLTSNEPATYTIRVQGTLGADWSDRLGGLQITVSAARDNPITELVGRLPDQQALIGVLTSLYDLGLPLLSVERVPPP
ncbi:MAG TPA: hypothetical protein VH482_23950 [Thermomicrobiales bacterium]|jgi:hypothetical protein